MKTKAYLFLDDLRNPPHPMFTVARTVEEAMNVYHMWNILRDSKDIIISLDHDLGGEDGSYTKTGYDFCLWLVEKVFRTPSFAPKEIYLHTANPVGRQNMRQLLERYMPEWTIVHNGPISYNEGVM